MAQPSTEPTKEQTHAARTRELNDTVRYTMWSVFRLADPFGPADDGADRASEAAEVVPVLAAQTSAR